MRPDVIRKASPTMVRRIIMMTLPAVALAFGPVMPLGGAPALARGASCRAAAPALRMAVQDVGSEAELDAAIASAGKQIKIHLCHTAAHWTPAACQ